MEKIKDKPLKVEQELSRTVGWKILPVEDAQHDFSVKQHSATQLVGFPSWITGDKLEG
jgi:hypothetical protein